MSNLIDIILPTEVGEEAESLVVMWYKEPGDTFKKDEILVEVQTDKAIFEMPAEFDGVLEEILVKRGEVASIGQVMARATKGIEGNKVENAEAANSTSIAETVGVGATISSNKTIKATPLAKKLARENNVDLALLNGTGNGGKITDNDVKAYLENGVRNTKLEKGQDFNLVPNSPIRKATAKHMYASIQNSAQLTLSRYIEVSELKDRRKELMPSATWNVWVLRATILALLEHKDMNAAWVGEQSRKIFQSVNLGMAVDTDKGLLVPIIHKANKLSFEALIQKTKAQQQKALSNQLKNEDINGGTFTVTNLGGLGIDFFTPILNPPQVGILGVGKLQSYLDLVDNDVKQKWQLPLSITFDHRAIDGAPAARFLQTIEDLLNNPEKLI